MTSERRQRQIDLLLDEAEAAMKAEDWSTAQQRVRTVLNLDPDNIDAKAYAEAAERALGGRSGDGTSTQFATTGSSAIDAQPTSFANGRYSVTHFLGEGGKKRVYLAHDAQLDRDVAFALIKTEGLDDAARQRITREAQAMGRLGSHPHIVTVYDIGEENGQPYLVLPVLPGGDVEGVIEDAPDHKLSIEQAVKIATETCLGLEFCHAKGIIHRDLKPGNVWLAEDGRAMIGDLGLAVASDRSRLTQAGMMVGTPLYMPPEQAMGGEVTPQSDLYSLGAMLYEMVCGRPPFVGDESVAIIGQHLNTPPVAPTWHRPDCPPGLEALILRMLEKDTSKRPSSASEVREALSNLRDVAPSPTEDATPSPPVYDPLYRRTFVGRENETRQLQQAYDAGVSGQGALVMIAGEPGIGKTALCEQLETYVSLRGGKTLFGHCYEEGSLSLPYLAFVEAMRTYVLERDPDALESELGTGASEVARIISEVRDKVRVELRDASDPEDDRWRLLNSVTTFLRNAAQVQPLVIVLEDLHWADRGTLDLLLHLARYLEGARLLIVGTYRDVEVDRTHPLSATLADLRRINTFLRIPLRGLTVDEVHRMYETIRGNTVPQGQAEAVHRATEGNPLFVQEILRYLVEEGMVVRQGGEYVATSGVSIPEGLRDVVGRRLGHLGQKTNEALSVAAVIGRDFSLDVLQRVANLPEDELEAALEEASERSIIEQRQSPGVIGFRFTHAFFRQVLYEEIFAPRRIRWHQQVARALEEFYTQRLEDHAAELAEHFAQSVDPEDLTKAIQYGELAAKRAVAVFAHSEAVRHLQQALHAQNVLDPDDAARRCDLLLALGESLLSLGEHERVFHEVAPEALDLAEKVQDQRRAFDTCRLAMDSMFSIQRTLPVESMNRWTQKAEFYAGDNATARVRLNRRKIGQLTLNGFHRQALALALGNLELARSLNDPDAEFGAMWIPLGQLPYTEALQLANEFRHRSREGVSYLSLSQSLARMSKFYLDHGQREDAEALATELNLLADRSGDSRVRQAANLASSWMRFADGELEVVLEDGNIEARSQAASYLGWQQPDIPFSDVNVYQSIVSTLVMARAGKKDEAESAFTALTTELAPVEDEIGSEFLAGVLEIALLLQDTAAIQRLLSVLESRGLTSAEFNGQPLVFPAFRIMGDAAATLIQPEQARDYFETSVAFNTMSGQRPELALTRAHLAELLLDHYPEEHDAAIEHLDFAIAEFRDMKMQPALERALGRRGLLKA